MIQGEELGNLQSIKETNGHIEIITDQNEKISIDLIKDNVIRIWASHNQTLTKAKNKKAPIVIGNAQQDLAYQLRKKSNYHLLQTQSVSLRIYISPLRFEAYKNDNSTPYWQELKPIDISAEQSYQTLSSTEDEHFFGGGQQNGQFEFKGKSLEISYSGGWEEFDRPSPAPFYMSTNGYGGFKKHMVKWQL